MNFSSVHATQTNICWCPNQAHSFSDEDQLDVFVVDRANHVLDRNNKRRGWVVCEPNTSNPGLLRPEILLLSPRLRLCRPFLSFESLRATLSHALLFPVSGNQNSNQVIERETERREEVQNVKDESNIPRYGIRCAFRKNQKCPQVGTCNTDGWPPYVAMTDTPCTQQRPLFSVGPSHVSHSSTNH